ncbi:MAG: hypothetical protein D6732_13395 [Methanobacteriota archaeon]|nr:MAG: hypothetical protein D6732_13395 [Euryarchaeota archaeon]
MKKEAVFLEMRDLRTYAENSLQVSDIWELEFLLDTGLAVLDNEDFLKTVCYFLMDNDDPNVIANLLVHFSPKELPTALLEDLFNRFDNPPFVLMDQLGRLCSMDRKHPHYHRFVALIKEIILWKHSKNYLYGRERETWKLNHFDTILELVIDHGINIWFFGYQFSEEELGILRLLANDPTVINCLTIKANRINYDLKEHPYTDNLKSLMKMRKSELIQLCKKNGLKGYSKMRAIQIVHLLLSSVPSRPSEKPPKPWTTYWIEEHDFLTNIRNLKKMKLGTLRAIGYKYGVQGAFYKTKSTLIREILKMGRSKDSCTDNNLWQEYWLEEYFPEINLYNLQTMRKKELVKIGYKYGLKKISRLRKDEIIRQILDCDPRIAKISSIEEYKWFQDIDPL